MDKVLSKELKFKHIISKDGQGTKKTYPRTRRNTREPGNINSNTTNNNINIINNSVNSISNNSIETIDVSDAYFKELISRMNIINEELYDYIIFDCGYKSSSKEYKKEIKTHLDKVMISFFTKI